MKPAIRQRLRVSLDRYAVWVLDRGLEVWELLRDSGGPLRLDVVSRRLAIAKSSAFRILCTLERRQYVERIGNAGQYQLGIACVRYSRQQTGRPLSLVALPHMQNLLDRYHETVILGILRHDQVFFIEMLESPHAFRMAATVGTSAPVHSTAIGKAIAAHLSAADVQGLIERSGLRAFTPQTITTPRAWVAELAKTRARGHSEDNEETEPGASCLGAPIFEGVEGRVIGALSISGPTARIGTIKSQATSTVTAVGQAISRAFGYRGKSSVF